MTDVLSFGSDEPPRPGRRRWLTAGAVVLGLAVTAMVVRSQVRENPKPLPSTVRPLPSASRLLCDAAGGVVLDETERDLAQNRCDESAATGPWTVVVRQTAGSLAHHGAVITFPADADSRAGAVVWELAGARAQIRGDLPAADLAALVRRVSVVSGKPRLDPPPGYVVVFTGPYRAPVVQEAGYDSAAAGEQATLGASWIHTGLAGGGGFEDALYAAGARSAGGINNHPAVLSGVREGEGMLSWELAPGRVAFVAYGGGLPLKATAEAALHRLAQQTRVVTATQWQTTNPVVIYQVNDILNPGPWPVRPVGG
jgi:hypothetical protein